MLQNSKNKSPGDSDEFQKIKTKSYLKSGGSTLQRLQSKNTQQSNYPENQILRQFSSQRTGNLVEHNIWNSNANSYLPSKASNRPTRPIKEQEQNAPDEKRGSLSQSLAKFHTKKKTNFQFQKNMKNMIKQMTQLLSLKSSSVIESKPLNNFAKPRKGEKSKIFVFNWNMHATSGPKNLEEFEIWDSYDKQKKFQQNELLIFTCQESCQTIPQSFCFNSKKRWREKLDKFLLGLGFQNVSDESLNALSSIIFIRRDLLHRLKGDVQTSKLNLGFFGILPNKGAIINTFKFKGMQMASINVHLPHGSTSRNLRNAKISRILKKLFRQTIKSRCGCFRKTRTNIVSFFDFVSFSGDFNFTFHMSKNDFIHILENGNLNMDNFEKLLQFDEYKPGTMKLSQVKKQSLLGLIPNPKQTQLLHAIQKSFDQGKNSIRLSANVKKKSTDLVRQKNKVLREILTESDKQSTSLAESSEIYAKNNNVDQVQEPIQFITLTQLLQSKKPTISLDKRDLKKSGYLPKNFQEFSKKRTSLNLQRNRQLKDKITPKNPNNQPGPNYFSTEPLHNRMDIEADNAHEDSNQHQMNTLPTEYSNIDGEVMDLPLESLPHMRDSNKTVKKTVFGQENLKHLSNVTQKIHSRLSNLHLDDSSVRSPLSFQLQNQRDLRGKGISNPGKPFHSFRKENNIFQKIDLNRPLRKQPTKSEIKIDNYTFEIVDRTDIEVDDPNNLEKKRHTEILKKIDTKKSNASKKSEQKISKKKSKKLRRTLQREKNNKIFEQEYQILEGKINFPPTYKFFAGTSIYYLCNQRLPGYPDRIFYITKKNGPVRVRLMDYKSCFDIEISDHKPVYASFELNNQRISDSKQIGNKNLRN